MRGLVLLLLVVGILVEARAASVFRRNEWHLPEGFNVEPFVPGVGNMVSNARSLSLSGGSKLNGPTIAYVGSVSYADVPMNVRASGG